MTLLGALHMGREQARARMTETVSIGVLEEDTDPFTYEPVQSLDAVYSGAARVKFTSSGVSDVEAAGQIVAEQSAEVHLPSGTTGVTVDMRVLVDASDADPALVGRVFRIKGAPAAGQTTAARFPVEETGERIEVGS